MVTSAAAVDALKPAAGERAVRHDGQVIVSGRRARLTRMPPMPASTELLRTSVLDERQPVAVHVVHEARQVTILRCAGSVPRDLSTTSLMTASPTWRGRRAGGPRWSRGCAGDGVDLPRGKAVRFTHDRRRSHAVITTAPAPTMLSARLRPSHHRRRWLDDRASAKVAAVDMAAGPITTSSSTMSSLSAAVKNTLFSGLHARADAYRAVRVRR